MRTLVKRKPSTHYTVRLFSSMIYFDVREYFDVNQEINQIFLIQMLSHQPF